MQNFSVRVKHIFFLTCVLIVLLCGLATAYARAQTRLITGKVFDSHSHKPVAFASVRISGKPIGTVTNANGEFDFRIPETCLSDSLIISHVGYKSFRRKIDHLPKEILFVGLEAIAVLLREVIIRGEDLTGKEIVAKAVNNLNLNYPTRPYCVEGFFRQIE